MNPFIVIAEIENQKYNSETSLFKPALDDTNLFVDYGSAEKKNRSLLIILNGSRSEINYNNHFLDLNTNTINCLGFINKRGLYEDVLGNTFHPKYCYEVIAVSSFNLSEQICTFFIEDSVQQKIVNSINGDRCIPGIDILEANDFSVVNIKFSPLKKVFVDLSMKKLIYVPKNNREFRIEKNKLDKVFDCFLLN